MIRNQSVGHAMKRQILLSRNKLTIYISDLFLKYLFQDTHQMPYVRMRHDPNHKTHLENEKGVNKILNNCDSYTDILNRAN